MKHIRIFEEFARKDFVEFMENKIADASCSPLSLKHHDDEFFETTGLTSGDWEVAYALLCNGSEITLEDVKACVREYDSSLDVKVFKMKETLVGIDQSADYYVVIDLSSSNVKEFVKRNLGPETWRTASGKTKRKGQMFNALFAKFPEELQEYRGVKNMKSFGV